MAKTKSKRNRLRLAVLLISGLLVASMLSACALVTVNPTRDNAQVIATIKGKKIKKSLFNNAMVSMEIYQTASGGSMPTGSELDELKQEVLDNIVQTEVLAQKAKDDGLTVDEDDERDTGLSTYKSVKKEAAKKYKSILKTYNTTDKSFKQYMQDFTVDTAYADKASDAFDTILEKNPDKYFGRSVGTVDGKKVDYGTYYYYYTQSYLSAYMQAQMSGTSLSESDLEDVSDEAMTNLAYDRNLISYAKKNNIKITDDAYKDALDTLKSTDKTYFSTNSDLDDFLSTLSDGLTHTQYAEGRRVAARADAASKAIKADIKAGITISNSAIQKEYEDNKTDYDDSTVSAMHILTTKKSLAEKIMKQAKKCKTKEDFEKLMEKYPSSKKNIEESTDLGAFTYSDMVAAFSKAAFAAKKNTAVGPIKTDYGYHVIFVYDKHTVKNDSWKKHKAEIKKKLLKERTNSEFKKVKSQLKDDNPKIKIDDPIKTALQLYADSLKKKMNVTVNDDVI